MKILNREGDLKYYKREAENWQRKYEAAIRVMDQLAAQLEKTQSALFKYVERFGKIEE